MQAYVYTRYGPPEVLELKEIEQPIPKDDEVLVKVHATSLNAYDWHLLRADPFLVRLMAGGLLRPKTASIPGADIAGVVEAVGSAVTQFQPGQAVYGEVTVSGCGGYAEFAATVERALALKPENLTFEQAAAVPMAGMTALQGLRDVGAIQPGQKVLIQGASGGVGTFAVQLAKHFGTEVTGVCSTGNIEMVRSLGADFVIDYKKEDFTKSGVQYDLILAVNGYHPLSAYQRALTPQGRYVMAGGTVGQMFQAILLGQFYSKTGGRRMGGVSAKTRQKDLLELKELIESGAIKPVIDKVYPFSQAIEALRYIDTKHAKGKVVVTVP
jgi:NADPH:quinone reductase-like Zn-dependent oxidoreductase